VLGADVSMIERFCFLGSERQDFLTRGVVRNISDIFRSGPVRLLFDFHPDVSKIETEFCKTFHRDTLVPSLISPSRDVRSHKIWF